MLSDEMRTTLIQAAIKAGKRAYAPYSNYAVGAAILSDAGEIFEGANVENAAYPASMCAERVAVFNAVSKGMRSFKAIAVVTSNGGTPCGSCRQVLSEFGLDIVVLIANDSGRLIEETTVADLLPGAFGPDDLPTA